MIISPPCALILKRPRTDIGHTERGHHLFRHGRDLAEIAARTRRHLSLAEDDFFCSATTQRTDDASKDLLLGDERGIFTRNEPR